MIESAHRVGRYFGITGLDFRLTRDSRRRILQVSILPLALLCAMLVQLMLDLYFGTPGASYDLPPERWQRVLNATATIDGVLPPICLASLVLSGISRWSRAEASWMLAIGVSLIVAAVAAAGAATAIRAIELDATEQYRLRVFTWGQWASNFGLLAAGYSFVACRSLAADQTPRPKLRRYRPQV